MENINDIIASLTPEDIASLKSTAEAMFGSDSSSQNSSGKSNEQNDSGNFNIGNMKDMDINSMLTPDMLAKLAQIMSAMNNDGGRRCHLIEALKPNLSENRQKKADEAIQILKLLDILPMLTNLTNKDG